MLRVQKSESHNLLWCVYVFFLILKQCYRITHIHTDFKLSSIGIEIHWLARSYKSNGTFQNYHYFYKLLFDLNSLNTELTTWCLFIIWTVFLIELNQVQSSTQTISLAQMVSCKKREMKIKQKSLLFSTFTNNGLLSILFVLLCLQWNNFFFF